MWEIYSIGDSAFLEQVLNAVAMITGTGDFTSMVRIGLLIGVLMVSVQALMQGGRGINFQHVLVSWLVFATMFGPSTRVSIEDAYTGQVRVVDNVPTVLLPQAVRFRLLAFKSRDCLKRRSQLPR